MTELDPKDSVRKEQLGNIEDTKDDTQNSDSQEERFENKVTDSQTDPVKNKEGEIEGNISESSNQEVETEHSVTIEDSKEDSDIGSTENTTSADGDGENKPAGDLIVEEKKAEVENSDNSDIEKGKEAVDTNIEEVSSITDSIQDNTKETETDTTSSEEQPVSNTVTNEEQEIVVDQEQDKQQSSENAPEPGESTKSIPDENVDREKAGEEKSEDVKKEEEETSTALPSLKDINYTTFSKEELVDTLRKYISEYPLEKIKNHVETIKSVFYKIHNEEIESIYKKFIEEGGKEEDFKVEDSPIEINMKELINIYREKRKEQSKNLDDQKEINLQTKYDIIDAIKELINSQESLNKTFHDFRGLQESWREVGPVPQKNLKDLWESYHYHVEAFYDYIKINKELRDLDFKKNLDLKLKLCEKAEELLLETSVVEAFRSLQVLHDQWREIGPVPADKRSEIWERFRDATSKINRRHQEYFVNLKEEQKKNLQEKTLLCEKAEEISLLEINSAKDWESKSKELIDIQKIWKTIGFAPKKHNTKIYERFRAACDSFFDKKREYFASNREEQENNLQLKTELCIQAEALQDNTDWKKTTDELIKLQKRWKTIGPVPIKQSDKIWKRFRAACDTFFNNKSKFYENIDTKYEDNLKAKEELIQKINTFELTPDVNKNLDQLKTYQREWAEIGFVPLKMKDEIQEKYREAINGKFDQLKIDDERKSLLKFRSRIESIVSKPNSDKRLFMERDKCYNKLKQLENDITLWENNIGFFSNSKNAESMITDVERKIESAKEKIEILQEKINIIDEFD
jgi:hypothetical protein